MMQRGVKMLALTVDMVVPSAVCASTLRYKEQRENRTQEKVSSGYRVDR